MLEFKVPKQIGGGGCGRLSEIVVTRPLVSLSCGVLRGCGMTVISMVKFCYIEGVSASLELWRVDLALSLKILHLGSFVAMTQPRAPALIPFPYKIGAGLSLSLGCWIRA